MRRRLRRLSAAAASAGSGPPPKRSRTRGRYDRSAGCAGGGGGCGGDGVGSITGAAGLPGGPFTGGTTGLSSPSRCSKMASSGPARASSPVTTHFEGWLNVWAINGVQRLYLFDDGAVPQAEWQPRFCVLTTNEQMLHHHYSEAEYLKTAVPACNRRRLGHSHASFCEYWRLPYDGAAESTGEAAQLPAAAAVTAATTTAAPVAGAGLLYPRKSSLSSNRGRDSSYDRALDEERRGSLPASIGSSVDTMPVSCQPTNQDEVAARSVKVDQPDFSGSPTSSVSTVNGTCETGSPASASASPAVGRPVGLYMKKGLKQAVQNIRRASSIGKLDKKKPAVAVTPLLAPPLSAGTSLPGSDSPTTTPKSTAQPALLRSVTKVDAPAESGWSAVALYSRLKRSMSLSKLTRKRTNPRLDESGGVISASNGPTSSKLKTALSCESLLTAAGAGPKTSAADIGEGNVQVQPLHPSVLGQENCFQIVTETGGSTFYACQSPEERDQWMACIRRAIHPGEDKSHRTHVSLKLWVQEAKNCLPKKKYFCEITLDKTVYARTSVKTKTDMLFWGEQFEFDNLPELATIAVSLYRDTEKKKRLDRNLLVGQVTIPVSCLSNHQITEKWYPLSGVVATSGSVGRSATKPELLPQIRLKARYQKVHVLPLALYADLLHYVQANYLLMIDNLEPSLSVRAKDDIAGVLVSIMLAEGKAKDFLCDIVMADVLKQDNRHLTFRSNTIATKAVEAYMKIVGRRYLRTVLSEFVRAILDSGDDCEVDPAKLHASSSSTLQRQQLSLLKYCETAWFKISSSISEFPRELQDVFSALRVRSNELGKADVADNLISSCVFLRFLCPAIMSPSLFGLCQDFPDERSARSLTLVAKTIQSLANFSKFGGKEDYMLHMNEFVEREWVHMQAYLQRISTVDARMKLAPAEYPSMDVGKELGLLHALLIDEFKGEAVASSSSAAAAVTGQQPQTSGDVTTTVRSPPQPLDGLRLLLLRISDDLASPRVLTAVAFNTSGLGFGGGSSSPGGQTPTAVPAAAAAAVNGPRPPVTVAALPPTVASPTSDFVEFAWRQPPKPSVVGSASTLASASGWSVHTDGPDSGAKATNTNETRSTAKPVEVAEQPMAFTSPASLRPADAPLVVSSEVRRRDSTGQHAAGRHPAWQQHTLSGDYVDLVTLPNGSSTVLDAHHDDPVSSMSSSSRAATPSSGYASCSAGAACDDFVQSSRDGPLATSGGLHKALPAGVHLSEPPRKELYGSKDSSPTVTRAALTATAGVQATPRGTSSFASSSSAAAPSSASRQQQQPTPLVFINPGYQRRPSAGGLLPSRSTRRPAAAGATGTGGPEDQALLASPSVTVQASPALARFQTLPNRYGSQSAKQNKAGPAAKPDARSGSRPSQAQQEPEQRSDGSRMVASTRSDQEPVPLAAARVYKSLKGSDGALPQSSLTSCSPPLQCRAGNSGFEHSSSHEALLAARDEKRYGCAAFTVADLDSPAQSQRGAKTVAGIGGGGGGSSSATPQRRSEQRVRAHSASSADDRGDGSGGESPPSERSWSSSQGSFSSSSARTIQRKLEEHEFVKKEHEGMVEALKSQLEVAQRRLEETEERLAKQAEQTSSAMTEWRQRLDASEAKLYAQQKEKDVQMQAILDRLHCMEEELRREQQEMKGSILQRQRMIELQERRIEQLDAANARLLGSLQQLKERVGGNNNSSSSELKTAMASSLLLPTATGSGTPAAAAPANGDRQLVLQAAVPPQQQQQTTYKTILYYSHDAGKTGFV